MSSSESNAGASTHSAPDTLLGAILVRNMQLPLRKLQDALDLQKQAGGKLGQILIERGDISEEQLQRALRLQIDRRAALEAEAAAGKKSITAADAEPG